MKLEVLNLSFTYEGSKALDRVSFSISAGERLGIIGPNGSGKSTLLKCINGKLRPQSGNIQVEGRDAASLSRGEMARWVGMVPQASSAAFPFTVEEVVSMGRYAHQGFLSGPAKKDREVVKRCMDLVEISDLAVRRISELSGGEYQRVIIARALAQEPRILLLDEPTAHLDIGHQLEILDLVSSLALGQGLAVGIVIHDLNLAFRFTDKLLLLDRGAARTLGTTREVFDSGEMEKAFHVRMRRLDDAESGFMAVLPFAFNTGGES